MKVVHALPAALLAACTPSVAPELAVELQPLVATRGETDCGSPWVATVRNDGPRPAPAVVLLQSVSGEPHGTPLRISPGPGAGDALTVALCRPSVQAGEWCVRVQLQQVHADDPADRRPGNDRWCLPSSGPSVVAPGASEAPSASNHSPGRIPS